MADIDLRNLKMVFEQVKNSETAWNPNGIKGCNEENFVKNNPLADKSIFKALDTNKDGYISEAEYNLAQGLAGEDGILTDKERNDACMEEIRFFARRNIDKWFTLDKDRNLQSSNVEGKAWDNRKLGGKDGDLSVKELEAKYNLKDNIQDPEQFNLEQWMTSWTKYLKDEVAQKQYGVELTPAQLIEIKKEMIKQLNTWLMKSSDNENAGLYERLNETTYTRLMTTDENVSCCGGSIDRPPMSIQPVINSKGEAVATGCEPMFSSMEEEYIKNPDGTLYLDDNGKPVENKNTAEEFKNRLAWAMFPTKTLEEQAKMTKEEYAKHQQDWNDIRNMSAADYRELLKPENKAKKEAFESKVNMTVKQIVDYIDVVENVTGKPWDSNDWEVKAHNWVELGEKVNGTYGDATRLDGKTRADIPENRQALLRYLEEKGWLYEQFK